MSRMLNTLLLAVGVAAVAWPAGADDPCTYETQTEALIAGQNFYAGTVTVTTNGSQVCVKFETTGGWQLTETHLAIATSLGGIPQTKGGNPQPGQFPYSATHTPAVTTFTYCVPFAVPSSGLLYIATHAVVEQVDPDTGGIVQRQTAWAGPHGFPGKNWATYVVYNSGCGGGMIPD